MPSMHTPPMTKFVTTDKYLIGMIHVCALPGTPSSSMTVSKIVDQARQEADILLSSGFDALLIENMHDTPYLNRQVGPEIVASMTAVMLAIREMTDLPIGIQILAGANKAAIAVAQAANANFIRAEGFCFAHISDEGIMSSDAGELLRYRAAINANHIAVLTDIKKKHASHAITADTDLKSTCEAAAFFQSDGIIITGFATGKPASIQDVKIAESATELPIFVGSGITSENLAEYWSSATGFIVGSSLKYDGRWNNFIDAEKAQHLCNIAKKLKRK